MPNDSHQKHTGQDLVDSSESGMERNSRKLIRMLKYEGWELDRINGDHHTFKHPERVELITITHPKKDLPVGQIRSIYRIAGWKP